MRNSLFVFFLLAGLYALAQPVKIKLFNGTGYDIKNLSYQGIKLGSLKAGGAVSFRADSLQLYLDAPMGILSGTIKDLQLEAIRGLVSSKNVSVVRAGNYTFDIILTNVGVSKMTYALGFGPHGK